jgi:hypothetical protein
MVGIDGDAEAHRNLGQRLFRAGRNGHVGDGLPDALGNDQARFRPSVWQQDEELFPAEARRKVGLPHADEELAFYDALEVNDSAVKVLGDETLRIIARELVETVHKNITIDWTVKESVRAKLRTMVKRILRKNGYPPDKQEKATQTVLEQAELLCKDWAAVGIEAA